MGRLEEQPQNCQNSKLRALSDGPTRLLSKMLLFLVPGVMPNQVSESGAIMYATGKIIKTVNALSAHPHKGLDRVSSALEVAGLGADLLDGSLARLQAELEIERTDSDGATTDTKMDRVEEIISGWVNMLDAWLKNDRLAFEIATAESLTAPLPSISRALIEMYGGEVPEFGFGTRGVRVGLSSVGDALPKLRPATDFLAATGNISTTYLRLKQFVEHRSSHDGIVDLEAEHKLHQLVSMYGVSTFGTICLHEILRRNTQLRPQILEQLGADPGLIDASSGPFSIWRCGRSDYIDISNLPKLPTD